jgi:hypothetical protein
VWIILVDLVQVLLALPSTVTHVVGDLDDRRRSKVRMCSQFTVNRPPEVRDEQNGCFWTDEGYVVCAVAVFSAGPGDMTVAAALPVADVACMV